eukprot:gene19814-14408_t
MKRASKRESKPDDVDVDDVESEEEPQEEVKPKKKSQKKNRVDPGVVEKEEKKGYNWGAIVIMLMFAIPMLITGTMQAIDMLYPEAAKVRQFRQQVMRCYEAANPSKVSEVD